MAREVEVMRTWTLNMALFAALPVFAGCGVLDAILQPNTVNVLLVNQGDFDVQADVYISGEQLIPRDLLTEVGEHLVFTLRPGETASFSRNCDDLQAIVIDPAELSIIGQIGPTTSSNVLRDGDDFGCGDAITFTFDHSILITDFSVSWAVTR